MENLEELERKFQEAEKIYTKIKQEEERLYFELDMVYTNYMTAKTGIGGGSIVDATDRSGKPFRGIFKGWNYAEKYSLVRVTPIKKNGEPSQNVRLVDARDMKPVSDKEA